MGQFSRFWNQSFFIPKPALTEKNLPDQSGRVFIVTGGYTGCGLELAKILYQRNGTVYLAGRSQSKADSAMKQLKAAYPQSKGRVEFMQIDLSDLTTLKPAVEAFSQKESRLDVLTNNAGVMIPPEGSVSKQNYELQIATNAIGPYLLTKLLTPIMEKTAKLPDTPAGSVRVTWAGSLGVDVASPKGGVKFDKDGNYEPIGRHPDYGASKAANVFLATQYAKRHAEGEHIVISNAWNPGNLQTELQRHSPFILRLMFGWMLHPSVYGGYTELFAGWSGEAGHTDKNGAYVVPWGRFSTYRDDIKAEVEKTGGNAEKFWDWCERETKDYS